METMEKALFIAAFFFAYTVQAITGFAGNVFAMPVGTQLLGLSSSVAILNAMGFFACGLLTIMNFKSVNWRELAKIVLTMLPFVLIGIWLDTVLPLHILLRIYGVIIVAIGLKNLLQKRQKFLPEWALWTILALAGLVQGMFVSGGALLVIYTVQKLQDKQQFRMTLSATWAILNLIYAVIAFGQGSFTGEVVQIVLMCVPVAVLATWIGNRLQKKISQEKFLKLTYVLLLFVGVGGYNTLMLERQKRTLGVYFSCGMPWKRAAFVLLTGNALLFLIGGAGGALWGMYSANSIRPMMEDSKLYSVLTGLALVVVLLLVSSAFTIWKMRKLSPVALMKKEDAD